MNRLIPFSILLILLYFVFFTHLGKQPIRLWDESRLAFNAIEMAINGNVIVTHFEGKPDMWNVKPPFMIWCQASMIKLLGPTEVAIRIPAAVFGILTALLLFFYCWRYYDKFWMGIFAAMVLATTRGYIDEHCARHGEYDSVYIFFIVLYTLSFLQYFEQKKIKFLYIGIMGLTLAILTKGIAGAFALPVVGIAALLYSSVLPTLKSRHFYISLACLLFFAGGYYFLREHYNPGYLKAVMDNEISGRYLESVEGHNQPRWMYLNRLTGFFMKYWAWFIPIGFVAGLMKAEPKIKRLLIYCASYSVFQFIIVTIAETKLDQYIYPVFPFLALIVAYLIWLIFDFLFKYVANRNRRYKALPYIFVIVLFFKPYKNMLERTYQSPDYFWDFKTYSMGYFLKDVLYGKQEITEPLKIFYYGYKAHLTFYIYLLQQRNIPVTVADSKDVQSGDLVMCSKKEEMEFLKTHFVVEHVREGKDLYLFRLKGLQPTENGENSRVLH